MGTAEREGLEEPPPPYVRKLNDPEGPIHLSWFRKGTAVYPAQGAWGYLHEPINARPTGGLVRGYKGFTACTTYTLWRHDIGFHSHCANIAFGVKSSNEHTQTIK